MDVDDGFLALFDLLWFRRMILLPYPMPPAVESPVINGDSDDAESIASEPPSTISTPSALLLRRHRRCRSDDLAPSAYLRIAPKLQTILSGKVAAEAPARMSGSREQGASGERDRWGRRKGKGGSKSLTDLEFQELKGFMDLGFTFSDAEAADPRLLSIVPGLQRLRETATSADGGDSTVAACSSSEPEAAGEVSVVRPYLSEAWDVEEREERGGDLLRNWRFPAAGEGIDLKDQLRIWVHAVASAVR